MYISLQTSISIGETKMKSFLAILIASLFLGVAFANDSFTLIRNSDRRQFYCNANGSPLPPKPSDPYCVQNVTDYCKRSTAFSANTCFDKASQHCPSSPANYAVCVQDTTDYCKRNTAYSANDCFDQALLSCRGNTSAIHSLLEGTRLSALKK